MGRKIELRIELGVLIKKLRRLDYFLEVNNVDEATVETICKMLRIAVSDAFIDLILEEGKASKSIAFTALKKLAYKLHIPRYFDMTRESIIKCISAKDAILGDYIRKGECCARGIRTDERERPR